MATVSLTFDVDAEAGLGAQLERSRHRLGTLTEREFSVGRGLPRIVELLGEHGMRGTFTSPTSPPSAIQRRFAHWCRPGTRGPITATTTSPPARSTPALTRRRSTRAS